MMERKGVSLSPASVALASVALLSGCSVSEAPHDPVGRSSAALEADAGFEDSSVWSVIAGSAVLVDGGASLRLQDIDGYVEIQNADPYGTLTADGSVRLSVNIPDLPWGHAALYFDVPSRGIHRQYVGPVDLTELPAGDNELTFTLPSHVSDALAGTYDDFKLGIAFAVPTGTLLTLRDLCFSNCDAPDPEPLSWTSRDIWTLRNVGWASYRNMDLSELQTRFEEQRDAGRIPIGIGAKEHPGGSVTYSTVWRDNVDGRGWAIHWGLDSDEYHARWEQYRDEGLRPLGVTSYRLGGNAQRFAGIWIENRENLRWASARGLTSDEYGERFDEYRDRGLRPIDIEVYETNSGNRLATVWWENVDNIAWQSFRGMSRELYNERVDARAAEGYLLVDYDAWNGDNDYGAIWEMPAHLPSHWIRTNRGDTEFANYWRQYRDEGYRPFHVENHGDGGDHFAGIWVQNDDRWHYDRKQDIDSAAQTYRSTNDLPGISVAVIRDGDVIYRRGFGWADVGAEKVAHGETVYNAASVSKVIGGTLAAKLEDEGVLRDGTPVSLDMTNDTSMYIFGLPNHHAHTVEQLTAHLACIPHYDTSPSIENRSGYYFTAVQAVEDIWDVGLVSGCTIGSTRSYSTAAFTFLGAVLEAVAGGRSIHSLVETELAEPYGLTSLRSQFGIPLILPANYDRAEPYDDDNDETSYDDSSWKVLGGGIEIHAVDLARFGSLVLHGQIVSPDVRDNRLFAAVAPGCGSDTGGICTNGVAWERGDDGSGRRIAEHSGSWTGARSLLRVYPDDDLVIAIMSNRTDHSPDIHSLGTTIGNIVLAP